LIFGLPYPPDSLTGVGSVLGHPVRCITPQWLVQFHTGYPFDENDYRDVSLLCRRYHLALPAEHVAFEEKMKSRVKLIHIG
jgi:lincosamide nucleotidyltransferase A/C/D/E